MQLQQGFPLVPNTLHELEEMKLCGEVASESIGFPTSHISTLRYNYMCQVTPETSPQGSLAYSSGVDIKPGPPAHMDLTDWYPNL